MNRLLSALLSPFVLCLLPGCGAETAGETGEDEDIAFADEALTVDNAIFVNALVPSAVSPGALRPSTLALGALAPGALSPESLSAIQMPGSGGDLSRMFLRYAVSCAFDSTQSFSFSWVDTGGTVHDEQYQGAAGIAPEWAGSPLSSTERQLLVSACLAARTNWYGTSVTISVRSGEDPLKRRTDNDEIVAFPYVEGAFWGNLFVAEPYLNACHHPDNVAHSRAAYRDCAAGHLEGESVYACGIITLTGPCTNWCAALKQGGRYYPACTLHPGVSGSPSTTAVITTAVQ